MKENQILYKDKKDKSCVCCGYYDRSFKGFVFKFTQEEMKQFFKDNGIKFRFKEGGKNEF